MKNKEPQRGHVKAAKYRPATNMLLKDKTPPAMKIQSR